MPHRFPAALRLLTGVALICGTLALPACDPAPNGFVRAFQATSRNQLVGGPAAIADVGDFVIENDQVRFVILDGGRGSPGPGVFGGSLVDADLQRPERRFRGGFGLDSLAEIFPIANLVTPNPESTEVFIEKDGSDGEAVILVTARADNYLEALEMLKGWIEMNIQLETRYILRPGERVLRMETTLAFGSAPESAEPAQMDYIVEAPSVFDNIFRFNPAGRTARGAVSGDFLFYGNKNDIFTPGYGFDIDVKLREIFASGCDSVNVPVGVEAVLAEGDRVSYAYTSDDPEDQGQVFVPLYASSFTAVLTHQVRCESTASCINGRRFKYNRVFAVGDGDAASAMREIYKVRGVATGELRGHVHDTKSGEAVSGVRVIALKDPGAEEISDEDLATLPVQELLSRVYAANRESTKRVCEGSDCRRCDPQSDPFGEPGVVTSMVTDRGTDMIRDGDFAGWLRPGSYLLVARGDDRPTSRPQRVTVEEGKTTTTMLRVQPPAELTVVVTDEAGRPVPAKVTLGRCLAQCIADADCGGGQECDVEQRRCVPRGSEGEARTCVANNDLDVVLGDPLLADNIVLTAFAGPDGVARIVTRPGEYEMIVSRGLEYDLDRQSVKLDSEKPVVAHASVNRVIDTLGWVSADFHVHGMNSHDSFVTHETRVLSMMAEGIELLTSTDHDAVTDFEPAVRALRAERFIKTQVGLEATTIESGHFLGHPLRYDALGYRGGGFNPWGLPAGPGVFCDLNNDGVFDPHNEDVFPPGANPACFGDLLEEPGIIGRLRNLGIFEPEQTVITIAHPRDGFFGYFDQFDLNPITLELGSTGSTLQLENPLVKPAFFSTDFNAIELFNAKRFELIRTPTIGEVKGFQAEMHELQSQTLTHQQLERRQAEISNRWVRKMLHRTDSEQNAMLNASPTQACALPEPVACRPASAPQGQCDGTLVCDPNTNTCIQPCSADEPSCPGGFGRCDVVAGRCLPVEHDAPCLGHRGVVDDWFRMLNAGVKKTAVGNSDTHSLIAMESGLPRNWVRSSTDEPIAIDLGEMAESVIDHRVVTSFGPFIRMTANGVDIGETLSRPSGPVQLRVIVESPTWFDVDRLEVYRNGELWKVVEADQTFPGCDIVAEVPNKRVINFRCTFEDEPGEDVWYVASALGLRGKDLRPVYTSVPILYLEIGDITSRAFAALEELPFDLEVREDPRVYPILPLAYTNPIWVDVDGDGFNPPRPLRPQSPFAQQAAAAFPLSGLAITNPILEEEAGEAKNRRAVRQMHMRFERALHNHHIGRGVHAK